MGNYCSSTKQDKDNVSDKSEESPSYQLASKNTINKHGGGGGGIGGGISNDTTKGAPLADPEPTSDISSNQNPVNTTTTTQSNNRPEPLGDLINNIANKPPSIKALQSLQSDSVSNSPITLNPPCDLASLIATGALQLLPTNLQSLNGNPIKTRRIERDRKIVIYILASDINGHKIEKSILHNVYRDLREAYACRGFEIQLSNGHHHRFESSMGAVNNGAPTNDADNVDNNDDDENDYLNPKCWLATGPIEAKGGHHLAATCLAEIARHSNLAYVIPVLFLGTSLGCPLLPLTIENQDFCTALCATKTPNDKDLLEKWYILDDKAQPQCYRLKTTVSSLPTEQITVELNNLLETLVNTFPIEMCDSYLTTVVEQEINNTVLISQEMSKRCIWIQTGNLPTKTIENGTALEMEMNRRVNSIHSELKNQLMEKNLIRIPPSIQFQQEQLAAVLDSLISNSIDNIVDEHLNKFQIPRCTFGVDGNLLEELEAVNQHSKILEHNCANFGIMDKIKSYITKPTSEPLVVYGKPGSGKSVLSAKVAQNIHNWLPNCSFIIRYTNLTPLSTDILSIIASIAEQICYLTQHKSCIGPHDIEFYATTIKDCVESTNHQICILIDSIDEALNLETLDWMPIKLKENVKIILTVTADQQQNEQNRIIQLLNGKLTPGNIIHLDEFSPEQWKDVLSLGGGDFYAAHGTIHLPESWKSCTEKIPLQAKIFWWLAWLDEIDVKVFTLMNLCDKVFETLEKKFPPEIVKYLITLIVTSRDGLKETELIDLLENSGLISTTTVTGGDTSRNDQDGDGDNDDNTNKQLSAVAAQIWMKFCWIMGPMLLHTNHVRLMDRQLRTVAEKRYHQNDIQRAHRDIYEYFSNQPDQFTDDRGKFKWYNKSKFIELPYHSFKIKQQQEQPSVQFSHTEYLTNISWIYQKINANGCVHLLNDIYLISSGANTSSLPPHITLLKCLIEQNIRPLNYDARQFYSIMPLFMRHELRSSSTDYAKDQIIQNWLHTFKIIPIPYLETLGEGADHLIDSQRRKSSAVILENNDGGSGGTVGNNVGLIAKKKNGYDVVTNLGGDGYFVASMSVDREEICVWDVAKCKKVRTLLGIPQPTSMCPVSEYSAAVLCRREIKVIDLNDGVFKVTLKGVMNQKMPYYGLHDSEHLVCLSRNRMYVNLMNLQSGDCVTTFKAGEDRFLNSLLVSGDGRILVCGDETQKPFPLLVWHLSQRKLLYDLRIPHHDFQTALSAITHEGAYVSVVAKELNEPTPNFIVVYDLQSGTLFKKWKPSCNTVSLAISQTQTCVIAGLEDARILIWDLVTGNCKYTLIGHNAPVTLLKLDPLGRILLSADKDGRDLSVRLWELDTGKALAVHTPIDKITTCELLPDGKFIVLALDNHPDLVTLQLHLPRSNNNGSRRAAADGQPNEANDEQQQQFCYGNQENEGKIFQL